MTTRLSRSAGHLHFVALSFFLIIAAIFSALTISKLKERRTPPAAPAPIVVDQVSRIELEKARADLDRAQQRLYVLVDQGAMTDAVALVKNQVDESRAALTRQEADFSKAIAERAAMIERMHDEQIARSKDSDIVQAKLTAEIAVALACLLLAAVTAYLMWGRRRGANDSTSVDAPLLEGVLTGLDRMEHRMDNLETIFDARRRAQPLDIEFDQLKGTRA